MSYFRYVGYVSEIHPKRCKSLYLYQITTRYSFMYKICHINHKLQNLYHSKANFLAIIRYHMIFDFFIRKVRAIYARMAEKLACNDINCIFYIAFEWCNSAKDYQFANGIYNFPQIRLYMLRPPNQTINSGFLNHALFYIPTTFALYNVITPIN